MLSLVLRDQCVYIGHTVQREWCSIPTEVLLDRLPSMELIRMLAVVWSLVIFRLAGIVKMEGQQGFQFLQSQRDRRQDKVMSRKCRNNPPDKKTVSKLAYLSTSDPSHVEHATERVQLLCMLFTCCYC